MNRKLLAICVLFFALQVTLQWANGAFRSEFGRYPDEAGHYVTGLMVRDYIASHNFDRLMGFAEEYYIHYPKVAIGHWPPFFYVVQAAWTLPFSASRLSIVLLMALLTTILAASVCLAVNREFGTKLGIVMGFLLITLPLIQEWSGMVMAEILVALLSFLAVLYLGRYLNTERWRDAIGFSIFGALTILTKGNGLALALAPPIALLLSGRFHVLTRPSFWAMPLVVLALCGPFYWETLDMVRNGWKESGASVDFTISAVRFYSYQLLSIAGIGLSVLVVVGVWTRIIWPLKSGSVDGRWASFGALMISIWAFQCLVPAGLEARHLTPAAPALLMFLAAGIVWVAERLPLFRLRARQKLAGLVLVVILVFGVETFAMPRKVYYGFGEIAQTLVSRPELKNSVFLISSDAAGEGMFVSEVAMRERRPGHVVLRSSKVLSTSRWGGDEYDLLHSTPKEIMTYLEKIPVGIVVIDGSISDGHKPTHHKLLRESIDMYMQRWQLLGCYSMTRRSIVYPNAVSVYRLIGHEDQKVETIRLNMQKMLGRDIEKRFEN